MELLGGLAPAERSRHARRRYAKGEPIFLRGDPGGGFYVVERGWVRLVLSSQEGKEFGLDLLGLGACFGELALLDGEPRSADAVAQEDCALLLLRRAEFDAVLAARPEAARALLAVLARRLRRDAELLAEAVFLDVPARLARPAPAHGGAAAGRGGGVAGDAGGAGGAARHQPGERQQVAGLPGAAGGAAPPARWDRPAAAGGAGRAGRVGGAPALATHAAVDTVVDAVVLRRATRDLPAEAGAAEGDAHRARMAICPRRDERPVIGRPLRRRDPLGGRRRPDQYSAAGCHPSVIAGEYPPLLRRPLAD